MTTKGKAPDSWQGTESHDVSPIEERPLDLITLQGAQKALLRLKKTAWENNLNGLLDGYLDSLTEELHLVSKAIHAAELLALGAWRKASGYAYITQSQAYARANERHQELMAERQVTA